MSRIIFLCLLTIFVLMPRAADAQGKNVVVFPPANCDSGLLYWPGGNNDVTCLGAPPVCGTNEVVTFDGNIFTCTSLFPTPNVACGAGQALTFDGRSYGCVTLPTVTAATPQDPPIPTAPACVPSTGQTCNAYIYPQTGYWYVDGGFSLTPPMQATSTFVQAYQGNGGACTSPQFADWGNITPSSAAGCPESPGAAIRNCSYIPEGFWNKLHYTCVVEGRVNCSGACVPATQ